jgi:4-hydroxy-3-methylbut-2-enyl diphosphate reductase
MIVKRAAVLGRCMGVRRAVDLALKTAESLPPGSAAPVYTLGPLIHNPKTVEELARKGILSIRAEGTSFFAEVDKDLARPLDLQGATVIIRAHGVPPAMRQRLESAGASIVDATCPRVLASQRRAREYADKGWTVVIAGDRDHGEVTGIAGFAPGAIIVGSAAEASAVEATGPVALIAQTTIRAGEYAAIREALASRLSVLEVVDSICPATAERLASLADLARDCEALVVVGGHNSANTLRLKATALDLGRPAWLVEGPEELPLELAGYASVGVTAGASTPDEAIEAVEARLLAMGEDARRKA